MERTKPSVPWPTQPREHGKPSGFNWSRLTAHECDYKTLPALSQAERGRLDRQITQAERASSSLVAERATLVAESGVPAVTLTPGQATLAPLEALQPSSFNEHRNLYCIEPPQCQSAPTPTMGTAIPIAPPPSLHKPVPAPSTSTVIFIAPNPP